MLYGYTGFISDKYRQIEKMANKAQRDIINEVASKGSCVIVGRRADQILKENENVFRVFITASIDSRVKRVMERENLTMEDSKEKITRVDKERAEYYNIFDDAHWGKADNYDLCVDTDKVEINETVDMIARLVSNDEIIA